MDAVFLVLRIVFTLAATSLAGWCAVKAARGGLRPTRTVDGDSWQIVGDPDWGVRWGVRATLAAVLTFAGAPFGWPRTAAAWLAVLLAAVTAVYMAARMVLHIREKGVTPGYAATAWLVAGAATGAACGYAVLMSGSEAKMRTAQAAGDAQMALNAQSELVRNAVIAALVVFAMFMWIARRAYQARSLRSNRRDRRRPGQSTRDARGRQARAVRDPIPRRSRPRQQFARGGTVSQGRSR